jgi:hypothetical protein
MLRQCFDDMFAFPAENLQPHFTSIFCARLVEALYVECQSVARVLPHLLDEQPRLGAHTEVWRFSSGQIDRHVWCHRTMRPNGLAPRHQCERCGVLNKLHVTVNGSFVQWRCRAGKSAGGECGHVMKEATQIDNQPLGDEKWIVLKI